MTEHATHKTPAAAALRRLALAAFLQMLPATLLTPAIRPLVAARHGASEAVMQAFVSLGMLGAVLFVGLFARRLDGLRDDRRTLSCFVLADAALLALLPLAPTWAFLSLRMVEGAVHVAASTVLLARASSLGTKLGAGRAMGAAGGAIAAAVGLGSGLGGAVLRATDVDGPFQAAALVAVVAWAVSGPGVARAVSTERETVRLPVSSLAFPLGAAFLGRFAVGMLVVTFALFAHARHALTDAAIGGLFMLLTLPFAIGTYPATRLADRIGESTVGAAGALTFAASLAALSHVPTRMLGIPLFSAGIGAALVYAAALRSAAIPAERYGRARVMGLVNAAGCLGMALGPFAAWGVGRAAAAAGLGRPESVFAAAAIVLASSGVAALLSDRGPSEHGLPT